MKEQPTGELSFSAGFSSADAFLVDLSITQRNLRGRGQLLSFVIRASSNRREIDLRFTEPRFLGRNLAASFNVFDTTIDFLEEAGFRQSRTGGQVSFAFPLTENTSLQARYTLREEDIEFPEQALCPGILEGDGFGTTLDATTQRLLTLCDQLGGRLSSILGYSFTWDRRNDPIQPTRGWDIRLSQDFAGLGGDVQYLRSDIRGNYYYGIVKDVIASLNVSGGYIRGWGGDNVSINDRYFKGNNEFRGFDNAGVGPRLLTFNADTGDTLIDGVSDGRLNSLGGNLFGLATAEVSFPVGIDSLGGSLFIEAGTVGLLDDRERFNTIVSVPNGSLLTVGSSCDGITDVGVICQRTEDGLDPRVTAGVSVFWESPFGPIRFDFTQPIVKQPFDDRKSFQFTTSTRFR